MEEIVSSYCDSGIQSINHKSENSEQLNSTREVESKDDASVKRETKLKKRHTDTSFFDNPRKPWLDELTVANKKQLMYTKSASTDCQLFWVDSSSREVYEAKWRCFNLKQDFHKTIANGNKVEIKMAEKEYRGSEHYFISNFVNKVQFDENLPMISPLPLELRNTLYNETGNIYKVESCPQQQTMLNELKDMNEVVRLLIKIENKFAPNVANDLYHKELEYKTLFLQCLDTDREEEILQAESAKPLEERMRNVNEDKKFAGEKSGWIEPQIAVPKQFSNKNEAKRELKNKRNQNGSNMKRPKSQSKWGEWRDQRYTGDFQNGSIQWGHQNSQNYWGLQNGPNQWGFTNGPNQWGFTNESNQWGFPSGTNQWGFSNGVNQFGFSNEPNQWGFPNGLNQWGFQSWSNQSGFQNQPNKPDLKNEPKQSGLPNQPNQSLGLQNQPNQSSGLQNQPNQSNQQGLQNQSRSQNQPSPLGFQNHTSQFGFQSQPNQSEFQNQPRQSGFQNQLNQPEFQRKPNQLSFQNHPNDRGFQKQSNRAESQKLSNHKKQNQGGNLKHRDGQFNRKHAIRDSRFSPY